MPIAAGKYRHRIEIGRLVPDTESGDPNKVQFISEGSAWARKIGATMTESFEDEEDHSVEKFIFRIRWQRADDLGIQNDWAIKYRNRVYAIETGHDPTGTLDEFEIQTHREIERKSA